MQVVSIVFYVVSYLHKFDFRFGINETSGKKVMQQQRLIFRTGTICFRQSYSRILRDPIQAVKVKYILFSTLHGLSAALFHSKLLTRANILT